MIGYNLGNDADWSTEMDLTTSLAEPEVIQYKRNGWVRMMISRESDAPGKLAFVEAMREKFGNDTNAWNARYAPKWELDASFDELAAMGVFPEFNDRALLEDYIKHPGALPDYDLGADLWQEDSRFFLAAIADKFYSVMVEATRYFDSQHLIFSDRYTAALKPPDLQMVTEEAAP